MRNRAALVKLLDVRYESETVAIKAIADEFDLTLEQGKILWNIQLRQLAALSEEKLARDLESVAGRIAEFEHDLANLDARIARQLGELLKHADTRGTDISDKAADLPTVGVRGTDKIVQLSLEGKPKLERPDHAKVFKSKRYPKVESEILIVSDYFWLVYDDSVFRRVKLSYVQDGDHPEWIRKDHKIVGAISDHDAVVVATCEDTAGNKAKLFVVSTAQKVDEFTAASDVKSITSIAGLAFGQGGALYGMTPGGPVGRYRPFEWFHGKSKRRGAQTFAPLSGATTLAVLRVAPGDRFSCSKADGKATWHAPKPGMIKRLAGYDQFWTIHEENFVILNDNRKRLGAKADLVRTWCRKGEVKAVLPWAEWGGLAPPPKKGEVIDESAED